MKFDNRQQKKAHRIITRFEVYYYEILLANSVQSLLVTPLALAHFSPLC